MPGSDATAKTVLLSHPPAKPAARCGDRGNRPARPDEPAGGGREARASLLLGAGLGRVVEARGEIREDGIRGWSSVGVE